MVLGKETQTSHLQKVEVALVLPHLCKGALSPFGWGFGSFRAAEPALCTTLAVMLEACSQFTCFQISLQVLKFSPGLF